MKLLTCSGIIGCLLLTNLGCELTRNAGGYLLWHTAAVTTDPDALLFAKRQAGLDTFPVKNLQPPPDATNLLITYGDEDDDGVVYFAHSNQRLHYQSCITRVQELLDTTAGQVNVEIRAGNHDPFSWERDFDYALRDLQGAERLNITWQRAN